MKNFYRDAGNINVLFKSEAIHRHERNYFFKGFSVKNAIQGIAGVNCNSPFCVMHFIKNEMIFSIMENLKLPFNNNWLEKICSASLNHPFGGEVKIVKLFSFDS